MDARMDEIYAAQYEFGGADGWRTLDAPMLTTPDALHARWAAQPPEMVAGNALGAFGARLVTGTAELAPDAMPRAAAILPLAHAMWARGEAVAPAQALPLYLRDKVAQTTEERDAARAAKEAVK
jgi:tRNA threonylcarbamoyladenosine biosynthesis protein TsaB